MGVDASPVEERIAERRVARDLTGAATIGIRSYGVEILGYLTAVLKNEADAIKALYGRTAEPSDKIKLDAPEIAENGGVVPISVTTTLDKVTSISFFVAENPSALAASYRISDGTIPAVANRLKMAKTTNVTAIVEADGKLYSATKEVKVTVGGCGG